MSARFHPAEDVLLAYAAGTVNEGVAIMVATHLSLCPACRETVACAEAVGGELMDDLAPMPMLGAGIMDRLDDAFEAPKVSVSNANVDPVLPRPLRDYIPGGLASVKWKWGGPGMKFASVMSSGDTRVSLMRIAPGAPMPVHSHSGEEFTMVLAGGYSDAAGQYVRGDVEYADGGVTHQPMADDDGECICLVVQTGRLKFNSIIARVLGPFLAP